MATQTTNYHLSKPDAGDQFSAFRQSYNDNMDIIDANLGGGGGGGSVNDVEVNGVSVVVGGVAEVTVPTQTSDLVNDSDFVSDASYVHTDNNFTTALKDKLDGIEAGAEVNVQADWNEADSADDAFIKNKPTIPTATSDLVNDSNFVSDASYVHTDNNFTTAEKTKLSGIESGAEVNVQSDWSQSDSMADDFIKNKPTIPTKVSDLTNDSGFTAVSVTQIQSTGTKIAEVEVDGVTTDIYAPTGGSGDSVSWSQIQQSGTKIAEIDINGTTTDVYAPSSSATITLVVTCDAVFQGEDLILTKGGTTLTQTVPAGLEVTFNVPSLGTWVLSNTYNADTESVDMNYYGQYAITLTGHTIPVGSTVTPTDDIQTLLNCADIWDKNYTTLSELLADTTTLQTVISSNNAIDYLVRSTSFAKAFTIPSMTSNSAPSPYVASASSESNPAYFAFNSADSYKWISANNTSNQWVQIDLGETKTISAMDFSAFLVIGGTQYATASTFTVKGSTDGITFDVDMGSFSSISAGTNHHLSLTPSNVRYIRTQISGYNASYGGVNSCVAKLQFYGTNGITEDQTAMSYIGLNNYASNTLLANATWAGAIGGSTYYESVLNLKNPTMTSSNTPSGLCFASSYQSGNEPYKAFANGYWAPTSSDSGALVGYMFTQGVKIYRVNWRLIARGFSSSTLNATLQGSYNGSTYESVQSFQMTGLSTDSNVANYPNGYALITPTSEFDYYRVNFGRKIFTDNLHYVKAGFDFYGRADI